MDKHHLYYNKINKGFLLMNLFHIVFNVIMQNKPLATIQLERIKQIFSINIIRLSSPVNNKQTYFEVITSYGNMALITQTFPFDSQSKHHIYSQLAQRNLFIQNNREMFPIIYEQHLLDNQLNDNIVCLSLIEPVDLLHKTLENEKIVLKLRHFQKLTCCLHLLEQNSFKIQQELEINQLLFLRNSLGVYFDFTNLKKAENSKIYHFASYVQKILMPLVTPDTQKIQIQEVVFVTGRIYVFEPEYIRQAKDFMQLLVFMNAKSDIQFQMVGRSINQEGSISLDQPNLIKKTSNKIRKIGMKDLDGKPFLSINSNIYDKFIFSEGKCINLLRQVTCDELISRFIREGSLYKLQHFDHLVINIFKGYSSSNSGEQQLITVYPSVSKVDIIGFLIAYLDVLKPMIHSISYLPAQNTLKLEFLSRKNKTKSLKIVFYQQYMIKDQEISMIIQKSRIQKCKVNLELMKITDTFLIFLSHVEKAQQIHELHITQNLALTDVGLSTFLKSPYSANLQKFSLTIVNSQNSNFDESIQLLTDRDNTVGLKFQVLCNKQKKSNSCLSLVNLQLKQLQCFGISINLQSLVKGNLKILKLDQLVSVEDLGKIKNLKLSELKIKIYEPQKKSSLQGLTSFASNLAGIKWYNPIRAFVDGDSSQSLKKLDLSFSICSFKSFYPLLTMRQLENITLNNITNLGSQFGHVCEKILSVSVANNELGIDHISKMLGKSQMLVELNISNTKVGKYEIVKLAQQQKLYINNLIISEHQFTTKLLEYSSGYQLIQCVQIYVNRILQVEQENFLHNMLHRSIQTCKTLRFILEHTPHGSSFIQNNKQVLVKKIIKFMIMNNVELEKLTHIYVEKSKIVDLFELQQNLEIEDYCQSPTASSVILSSDHCKIISVPKVFILKDQPIMLTIKSYQNQPIDRFTHRFVKLMYSNVLPICIDLSNNKLIGREVVKILSNFGKDLIQQVDFRNCLFTLDQVIDELFLFKELKLINKGQVVVSLNKENFSLRSQQYLKLFMRSKSISKLAIIAQEIQQSEILFSVLSHILDQCKQMTELNVKFYETHFHHDSEHFFSTLFSITTLNSIYLQIHESIIPSFDYESFQKSFNNLKSLSSLYLSLPSALFPVLQLQKLRQVVLDFNDGKADQSAVNRVVRSLANSKNIQKLKISFVNSPKINNLNKMFGVLPMGTIFEKLMKLEQLNINLEYCMLRELSLYQLLAGLMKNEKLKILQMNVSFGIKNVGELFSKIEDIAQDLIRPMTIRIISITQNSNNMILRTENLVQKGIYFII